MGSNPLKIRARVRRLLACVSVGLVVLLGAHAASAQTPPGTPSPTPKVPVKKNAGKIKLTNFEDESKTFKINIVDLNATPKVIPKDLPKFPGDFPPDPKDPTKKLDAVTLCSAQIAFGDLQVQGFSAKPGPDKKKCKACKTVIGYTCNIRLVVSVFVKKGKDTAKVKEHERAHVELHKKLFNKYAKKIAEKAAEKCDFLGNEYCAEKDVPPGGSVKATCEMAVDCLNDVEIAAASQMCAAIKIAAINAFLKTASDEFDEQTDHGRNTVPTAKAVKDTLDKAKKRFKAGKF